MTKINMILEQCYPHFTTISDGIPVGANAVCLVIRVISEQSHNIIQVHEDSEVPDTGTNSLSGASSRSIVSIR